MSRTRARCCVSGEAVGRKLDFLAQEFNREANTLCSKSADIALTRVGLALKAVIDQFREQAQNVEWTCMRDRAPRPDAGAVLALRRGQDHPVAPACWNPIRNITMCVSATTRPPRQGEVEGKDYFFVIARHVRRHGRRAATSWNMRMVFGNHYGTPKEPVMMALAKGRDVLFDIDWQGTQQLRQQAGDDLVSIFVLPPSHDELERRLQARAQDAEDVVAERMAQAPERDQPLGGI